MELRQTPHWYWYNIIIATTTESMKPRQEKLVLFSIQAHWLTFNMIHQVYLVDTKNMDNNNWFAFKLQKLCYYRRFRDILRAPEHYSLN